MPTSPRRSTPLITMIVALAGWSACGADSHAAPAAEPSQAAVIEASAVGAITRVVLENTGSVEQAGAPLTFGQVFAPGDLHSGDSLHGMLLDGTMLALQLDVKARHPDGSVRHAVISARAPAVAPGQRTAFDLVAGPPLTPAAGESPEELLNQGFGAAVRIVLAGKTYTASADQALRSGAYKRWLGGPLANEWLVAAPLLDEAGAAHPHLMARFAIRAFPGQPRARVDVTIENNWAYQSAPQNFSYDVELTVGDAVAYAKTGLNHYHHARWRKVFWWGQAPQLHIRHDSAYLVRSRALPNYDTRIQVSETTLASLKNQFTGTKTEPMGLGLAVAYMPATGGRPDIGLLPGWAASYLISMDKRAKDVMLGTADLAGSWSAHFRDQLTDRPVSLHDFPYMTQLGQRGDTYNPITRKFEAFPLCATSTACTNPGSHDASHQPGFAYLPYLVTGDYYYLEELQFWANWDSFMSNPGYREAGKGLVKPDQVRGQAWSLRTLGEAAYITPDDDPQKAWLTAIVNHNIAWYNAQYTSNAAANQLGMLTHGYALAYDSGTGVAPWMDDFFTSAVGHLAELGFENADRLLAWKVRFPTLRMTAPGSCWITGAIYALKVRDSSTAPLYSTMEQAWRASHSAEFALLPCGGSEMATSLKLKVGEMTGYSALPSGYPSNMQPALAYAADAGGPDGVAAWAKFAQRSVKPDYGTSPQFAIIPRN